MRSLVVVLLPEAVGREEGEEEHDASNDTSSTDSTEGITELITNWLTAADLWKAEVDGLGGVEEVWGAESRAVVRALKEFDNLHEWVLILGVREIGELLRDGRVREILWVGESVVSALLERRELCCFSDDWVRSKLDRQWVS